LYARDTVDETIFRDYDWDDQLASADVSHLVWDPDADWTEDDWEEAPSFWESVHQASEEERPDAYSGPERPIPDDEDLERGEIYPGPRDGYRFSVDSEGNPFEKTADGRQRIQYEPAEEIAEYVYRKKGGGGVIVNEANHAIIFSDNEPVFVGIVDPEEFTYTSTSGGSITDSPDEDELDNLL
jgi:hypothetical protein